MKYVIIGNSAAAVGCIMGIRSRDKDSYITTVTYENEGCYSKPMIADVLIDYPKDKLIYKNESFFEENGVNTIVSRVLSIDATNKSVKLESGESIHYDKLLVSTGAIPFVPPMKGVDKNGVFTFTEMSHAKELKSFIDDVKPQRIVVIGSGFIGLEVAYFLRKLDIDVVVVELLSRPLGRAIDLRGSEIVREMLESEGVRFKFENTVDEILGGDSVDAVRLNSGEVIDAQGVIVAIGVRPNVSLAKKSGLDISKGIVTDDFMKTTISDVYAAGDCVENIDVTDGLRKNLPLFPLAVEQGFVAGVNMSGGGLKYLGGVPVNSLKFLEVPIVNAGIVEPDDNSFEVHVNDMFERKGFYRKVVLKDNRLVGFVLIGRIERAGILTGLIRQRIDISSFKRRLLENDFGIVDLPASWREEKILKDKTAYEDWGQTA